MSKPPQHPLIQGEIQDVDTPLRATPIAQTTSTSRHRPGYARAPSVSFVDERLLKSPMVDLEDDISQAPRSSSPSGLGIRVSEETPLRTPQGTPSTIRRVPVGGGRRSTPEQQNFESFRALASPPSTGGFSGSTRFDPTFADFDLDPDPRRVANKSVSSLQSTNPPSLYQSSEQALLAKTPTASIGQQYREFDERHVCHSSRHFVRGMNNWLAITIVILSIFSTIFSGIFLILALHKPRYGDRIGTGQSLTVSTAAFLTSLFAKMIELSFITCVVAFVGQLLARRAFQKEPSAGVTLAEISMRSWIVQPGTMLTHWESVRYAGPSLLGFTALIAAIMAMLYTPASTALVQPQLSFSGWEDRTMQGNVYSSFANEDYLVDNCKTPITTNIDDEDDIAGTCIQIEHASQSYHNYFRWIADWTDFAKSGNGTRSLETRPKGFALLNDNTSIIAPWIEQVQQGQYKDKPWFVNNVTMAMPHPGIVSASIDPANGIMQPDQLNGLGIYSVRAAVPVPFVNVLCVMGMGAEDLQPLVYSEWKSAKTLDASTWPEQLGEYDGYVNYPFLNGTVFDDVFEWGESKYGPYSWPPVFAKLPSNYNTLINDTTGISHYGRTAVYVLGKGGPVDIVGTPTKSNYGLCQLRVGQTPQCSTQYNASSNVGTLEAICENPQDDLRYIKSLKNATQGFAATNADWPNVASMWLRSIELNNGLINGDASNARLWTELILTNTSVDYSVQDAPMALQPAFPSPAEALSVMAGCTLLQSAQDAPFVEFWNYSAAILDEPQVQWFNASVRAQQYASGGQPGYQQGFTVVLFVVFIINVIVLLYFLIHREFYTDFSDPTNLFSLAINSPPSEKLADCTCGAGNDEKQKFKHYWRLESAGGHLHIESPDIHEMGDSPTMRKRFSQKFETVATPVAKAAGRWRRKSSPGIGLVDTPTEQLYNNDAMR